MKILCTSPKNSRLITILFTFLTLNVTIIHTKHFYVRVQNGEIVLIKHLAKLLNYTNKQTKINLHAGPL